MSACDPKRPLTTQAFFFGLTVIFHMPDSPKQHVAKDIRQKVETIVGGNWDKTNAHGVNLRECLVEPGLVKHDNTLERRSDEEPEHIYLWVVLREWPEDKSGYSIVCDSRAENFGLATAGWNGPLFLGWYGGGFWGAFDSM